MFLRAILGRRYGFEGHRLVDVRGVYGSRSFQTIDIRPMEVKEERSTSCCLVETLSSDPSWLTLKAKQELQDGLTASHLTFLLTTDLLAQQMSRGDR